MSTFEIKTLGNTWWSRTANLPKETQLLGNNVGNNVWSGSTSSSPNGNIKPAVCKECIQSQQSKKNNSTRWKKILNRKVKQEAVSTFRDFRVDSRARCRRCHPMGDDTNLASISFGPNSDLKYKQLYVQVIKKEKLFVIQKPMSTRRFLSRFLTLQLFYFFKIVSIIMKI